MNATILTRADLDAAKEKLGKELVIVGVAISPRAIRVVMEISRRDGVDYLCGIQTIQDPRMSLESPEVFYDCNAWNARIKEQQKYDESRLTPL